MRSPTRILSLICVLAVVFFTASVSIKGIWNGNDGNGWEQIIRSDARGYYGYLTSIFIRNDLGNEPFAWEYVHRTPTGTLNKYFSGTALMMAPWFAIGHQVASMDLAAPKNGLSEYELKAISIGGWIYLLLGLLALRAMLLNMHIRDEVVAWSVVALGVGSTLLQYAALQPGWSHIYSFCAVSAFLYLLHRIYLGASFWWLVPVAALLGLIVLIRPVNALIVLGVPVLLGNGTWKFISGILARWYIVLPAIMAFAAVVFIQPLLWHAQTGNWFEWGYRNEGFYWHRPEVVNVLFSIRRGLFIWTPIFLAAAISVFVLWRHDRTRSLWALIYWSINLYVISCWWIWYYGSGFGSRVFIEHYPVFIIPLALILDRLSPRWWIAARTFFTLCISLHLVQFTQYHMEILHHERMGAKQYAHTFLKLDPAYIGILGGKFEVPPFSPNGMDVVLQAATDLEYKRSRWNGGSIKQHPKAFSGSHVCEINARNEFSITFAASAQEIPIDRELWLEVRMMRYEAIAGASTSAMAITVVQRADGSFAHYVSFRLNDVPGTTDDHWNELQFRIPVPPLEKGQELRFYIWNMEREADLLIDDLFLRVWAVRPY
ncbi:MAG: hypothetical protein M3R08_08640 [Bacteroidota bacterium]|nr:hypothetical protein [Bacteroidota bacterium]